MNWAENNKQIIMEMSFLLRVEQGDLKVGQRNNYNTLHSW